MTIKYSTAVVWWNNDVDFPSRQYVNNFVNSLSTYTKNVNFNGDGTLTIYDTNFNINIIYVSMNEGGNEVVTYYKKVSTIDNGNGIYEMVYEIDYWLTYMFKFLEQADGRSFNFLRNSVNNWDPTLNQDDPMLRDNEVMYNLVQQTTIPSDLTNIFSFSFTGLNNIDANADFYQFCNAVTYYIFKLNGSLIAIPVLSTNEVNQPFMWQSGTRPVTNNYRGIYFRLNGNYNNGMSTNYYYIYNFENVLKGLASKQGDNFVGKFFLPNLAYFNPKYLRMFRFTTSFSYNSNSVGGDPFITQTEQGINFLGIVLSQKVYNPNTQLLSTQAKIQLPNESVTTSLPTSLNSSTLNQEFLRNSNYYLMNNKIPVHYLYGSTATYSSYIYIYAFVFNQGGYCKYNNTYTEYPNNYNRYLSNFTNQEERTMFFGYQLPSETNAYLSWYNANKSQMETTKATQGLGLAMSSMFSVLGLILSGSGIGAPIGLPMIAGGAMGAFSSISGIAKTNANIVDTKRQLQTNYAQSNISDFNFLSLWFWYSSSGTWATSQYNIWQIQKPTSQATARLNNILYYFGYYQPAYLQFSFSNTRTCNYWQWQEDSGLKPKIINALANISYRNFNSDVTLWIYQRLINGIRLWNVQPPSTPN